MPDRDNWTAAMVLQWVLTRDLQAVFAMLHYGSISVRDGQVLPWPPRTSKG